MGSQKIDQLGNHKALDEEAGILMDEEVSGTLF